MVGHALWFENAPATFMRMMDDILMTIHQYFCSGVSG
jgi:hypothetical protein